MRSSCRASVSLLSANRTFPINGKIVVSCGVLSHRLSLTDIDNIANHWIFEEPIEFDHLILQDIRQTTFPTKFTHNVVAYSIAVQSYPGKLLKIPIVNRF